MIPTIKISIIIPVYNVELYLRDCLESIINQTEKNIEIIVVNDCSPDNSEEIILKYAKKDSRIIYLKHQINKLAGGARNTGLSIARGEYIWFVDSDDSIDINACEYLYNLITNKSTGEKLPIDVVLFNMERSFDKIISGRKYIWQTIFFGGGIGNVPVVSWQYLFKREFIQQERFTENVKFEDKDFIVSNLYRAKSLLITELKVYFYRSARIGSIMNTTSKKEHKQLSALQLYRTSMRLFASGYYFFGLSRYIDSLFIRFQIFYRTLFDKNFN